MEVWQKGLLVAAGAAGAAGVLYYLLREEPEAKRLPVDDESKERNHLTEEDELSFVQSLLGEIVESQEKMKTHMKDLTRELLTKRLDFEQTYERVKQVQPEDPLERRGMQMSEFDRLLSKHQSNQKVREGIMRIMGGQPSPQSASGPSNASSAKVIEVHAFMLEELQKVVAHVRTASDKVFEVKTLTLAAQAVVGAKVEEKFSLTSDDIESAVIMHHEVLAQDKEFESLNLQMQQAMAELMQQK
eukprot:TRINITY_DN60643_c0_g1_i1.p1 TRINITY_DN60643_c0_g1~~TRINITY_DN60643_c0_g1_i1.p1  ORF type:complete len:257 (+),score=70.95 TRINITY_DN60643_c0_g1_i1:42-773(+)